MQALAERSGSVISAALFGALAASGGLPFPRAAFEDVIRGGGKGVEASLRAFGRRLRPDRTSPSPPASCRPSRCRTGGRPPGARPHPGAHPHGLPAAGAGDAASRQQAAGGVPGPRVRRRLPGPAGRLERLDGRMAALPRTTPSPRMRQILAVAMAYDDVIRVADLKTRGSRFDRVRQGGRQQVRPARLHDGVHAPADGGGDRHDAGAARPPAAAPAGTHPGAGPGGQPRAAGAHRHAHGLRQPVRHQRLAAAPARPRCGTGTRWTISAPGCSSRRRTLPLDYDLAVETIACRRLVKGYSDTHSRGLSKFDRVLAFVPRLTGRPDGAAWLATAAAGRADGREG